MKRKIIQVGGSTFLVSIPSKWAKLHEIKKGGELDVIESGPDLLIKSEKTIGTKRISLDIEDFNEKTLRYFMSAIHKLGFDEIVLNYKTTKFNKAIDDLVKNLLLGFLITEQTTNKVVLKGVSREEESDFDPALRRIFLILMSLGDSINEFIVSKKFSELESLVSLENSIDPLASFCLRLINKGVYRNAEKRALLATIVWNLEKIGDEYRILCWDMSETKKEISKELIELFRDVNSLFKFYYGLFYEFSIEKLNELVIRRTTIHKKILKIKVHHEYDGVFLSKISSIFARTVDMSSSMVAMNYEKVARVG